MMALDIPDQEVTTMEIRRMGWLVWTAVLALPAFALDGEETRHLLERTGFGARPESIGIYAPLDRAAAVDRVLGLTVTTVTVPEWAEERPYADPRRLEGLSAAEREALQLAYTRTRNQRNQVLKVSWYRRMLSGEAPLLERMTLFWHNHFTSELRTVSSPPLMLRQHLTLHHHALGNYADLLRAMTTDPAMLVYLDGLRNLKTQPNENLARELLELFALGEGHYGEADIKAAARALSGWTLDPVSGTPRFRPQRHDDGVKTLFGRTGHWGLDGVIAILLDNPRTAELLVEKLWVELISAQPDAEEVKRLAMVFRESGYAINPLLRAMLLSDAFWAEENRGSLIKSPVELIVGTLWRFDLPALPDAQLVSLGRQMGQDLLDPPDVKGWRGYTDWIDTDRLLVREGFLRRVTRDLADESAVAGQDWARLDPAVAAALLWPEPDAHPVSATTDASLDDRGVRRWLIEAILDPRYQLK